MNKLRCGFNVLAIATLICICSSLAHAQSARVWVSAAGDDANPCSRFSPCKTFNGGLSKVMDRGEIDVLDSGAYGVATITKPVTIDGAGQFAGILVNANADGIVITAGPGDAVVLRHLSINGRGEGRNGIKFNSGKALHLEGCVIQNLSNYGVDFEPSAVSALLIRDSIIMNNGMGPTTNLPNATGSGGGIYVRATTGQAFVTIDNTRVEGNYLGVAVRDKSLATISNSVIAQNDTTGLLAVSEIDATAEVNVEHTVITLNATGIHSGRCAPPLLNPPGLATVRISNVSVTSNRATGLSASCGLRRSLGFIISSANNTILGNNPDGTPNRAIQQQ